MYGNVEIPEENVSFDVLYQLLKDNEGRWFSIKDFRQALDDMGHTNKYLNQRLMRFKGKVDVEIEHRKNYNYYRYRRIA